MMQHSTLVDPRNHDEMGKKKVSVSKVLLLSEMEKEGVGIVGCTKIVFLVHIYDVYIYSQNVYLYQRQKQKTLKKEKTFIKPCNALLFSVGPTHRSST